MNYKAKNIELIEVKENNKVKYRYLSTEMYCEEFPRAKVVHQAIFEGLLFDEAMALKKANKQITCDALRNTQFGNVIDLPSSKPVDVKLPYPCALRAKKAIGKLQVGQLVLWPNSAYPRVFTEWRGLVQVCDGVEIDGFTKADIVKNALRLLTPLDALTDAEKSSLRPADQALLSSNKAIEVVDSTELPI